MSPTMFGDEGYWLTRAGSHSRQEDGLKPGLEDHAVHPRTLLGEVRKRRRLTGTLETQRQLGCTDDGCRYHVGSGCIACQNKGDAIFSFHSFGAPRCPSLARLHIRSVGDAPVEKPCFVHVVYSLRRVRLKLRTDLGDACRRRFNVSRPPLTPQGNVVQLVPFRPVLDEMGGTLESLNAEVGLNPPCPGL